MFSLYAHSTANITTITKMMTRIIKKKKKKSDHGAITSWAEPVLSSTQVQHVLGCIYIYNLHQTWVKSFTSSLLQTCHLSAIHPDHNFVFQTADDIQWNASGTQPYREAETNKACFHLGMAKSKCTIPHSAQKVLLV